MQNEVKKLKLHPETNLQNNFNTFKTNILKSSEMYSLYQVSKKSNFHFNITKPIEANRWRYMQNLHFIAKDSWVLVMRYSMVKPKASVEVN